jgi:hypothetical protein
MADIADDSGMFELGKDLGFGASGAWLAAAVAFLQQLDRDRRARREILPPIDDAHSAAPDLYVENEAVV